MLHASVDVPFAFYPQQFISNVSLVDLIQCRYEQIKSIIASADDKCAKAVSLFGGGGFFLLKISVSEKKSVSVSGADVFF